MRTKILLTVAVSLSIFMLPIVVADDWGHERYDSSNVAGYSDDIEEEWAFDFGVEVSSSVVMSDNNVYFYDTDGGFHSFNLSEERRDWVYEGSSEHLGSPILYNGTAYIETDTGISAVENGETVWEITASLTSPPAVREETVYFGDGGEITAVDAVTGDELWRGSTEGDLYMFTTVRDGVYGITAEEGAGARIEQAVAEGVQQDYWEDRDVPDRINFDRYIDSENAGYQLQAFDTNGFKKWSFDEGVPILRPAVTKDKVFVNTLNYTVYALDSDTGDVEWTAKTDQVTNTPPVHSGGQVYVGTRAGTVHSFDADDGSERFSLETEFDSSPQISISEGVLYVTTTTNDNIYSYDTETGESLWDASVSDRISTRPTTVGSIVLFGSGSNIYAVNEGEVDSVKRIVDGFSRTPQDDVEDNGDESEEPEETEEEGEVTENGEDADIEIEEDALPDGGSDSVSIVVPLLVGLGIVGVLIAYSYRRKKEN